MSEDWEQDILEWVGDKKVKKLQSNNLIKFFISIFTAIGGFGGGDHARNVCGVLEALTGNSACRR